MRDIRGVNEASLDEYERIYNKVNKYIKKLQYFSTDPKATSVEEFSQIARAECNKVNDTIALLSRFECILSGFPTYKFEFQFPFLQVHIDKLNERLAKAKEARGAHENYCSTHKDFYKPPRDVEWRQLRDKMIDTESPTMCLVRGFIQYFNDYKPTLERVLADIEYLNEMLQQEQEAHGLTAPVN